MPKGHEIVAQTIHSLGVKVVFTLPDGLLLPIYEELEKRGVQVITMRHETSAAQAADGWARATRHLGVVLAPVGPGGVYLIPGLAQAYYAGSPVLAIAGRTPISQMDSLAFEEIDVHLLAERVVKYSRVAVSACHLSRILMDAIRFSLTGRMGPSLVELPRDVSIESCDNPELLTKDLRVYRPAPHPEAVEKVRELITKAKRPVIIVGSGAYWSGACNQIRKLSERTATPVLINGFATGCLPSDHPYFAGHAALGLITNKADLIIAVGTRWDQLLGFGRNPQMYSPNALTVQVDIEPEFIGKNRVADVAINSDALEFVTSLLNLLKDYTPDEERRGWAEEAGRVYQSILEASNITVEDSNLIKPQYLMKTIRETWDARAYYILDGGDTVGWAYMYLKAYEPGQVMWAHGPLGGIGSGIPIGLAYKLALKDRQVVVITGDGSFLMGAHELETAERYCIPLTVIVADDSAWGDVYRNYLLTTRNRKVAEYAILKHREYYKIAEAFGGEGYLVEDPNELSRVLARIAQREDCTPVVVQVRVDREEVSPLSQVLLRDR